MLLSALAIADPVQKLKWNIFWRKNWPWVSNHGSDRESSLRGSEAEIICTRSVSDWFNSGHLQISFSHLWILSLYIFFFTLNNTYWCNIFSLEGAFSTLMSQYCIFYFNGIFDLEVAFYKFIFDLDVIVLCFFFHAAFSNLMTFSKSMLHFLPWFHSFAFFYFDKALFYLDGIFYCEFKLYDPFKM